MSRTPKGKTKKTEHRASIWRRGLSALVSAKLLNLRAALLGLALLLFVFGIGVGVSGMQSKRQVEAEVRGLTERAAASGTDASAATVEVPSEVAPSSPLDNYRVAASLPRILTIDKIGVKARIIRLGVTADNAIAAPGNIFDAGWYDGSAKPGEAGAVFVDGHVSGPTQHGVFYDLKKLRKGDSITVERGDGQTFRYTVVATKTYDVDAVDMDEALRPIDANRPGLNLMTCAGQFDKASHTFKQRFVVFTIQN